MKVKVKKMFPPGHVRTPSYLRGKIGEVERDLGYFKNPEELAYGLKAHKQKLYRVRFEMSEIWGETCENPSDTIDAEIYEHWLEKV